MRKMSNWILAAVAGGALMLSAPSSAKAQVAFQGTFGGPHGRFSIGVGSPAFPVGAYVPYPYVRQIYLRPDYGYGFYYGDEWIACRPYGNRYVVIERPVVYDYGHRYYDYGHQYYRRDYRRDYRYDRRWDGRRWDDRRWDNRRGHDSRRNDYRRDWR